MELKNLIKDNFSELMEGLSKYFESSHHMPRKNNEKATVFRHILAKFLWGTSIKKPKDYKLFSKENK